MTADNQTKHPPPERPLPFWWRIPLGLACWALVSRLLFVLLVQPPKQAPDEFFHICVLQDGQPTFARFSDTGSWRGKALCREPVRFAARGCLQLVCEADFASESGRCKAKIRANAAHWRVFLTQQMPFYGVKAAAIPMANSP